MKTYWHNLLLSDQLNYRLPRHIMFWTLRVSFMIAMGMNNGWLSLDDPLSIKIFIFKISLEMVFCYAGIYWLFQKYLIKERYAAFGAGFLFTAILYNLAFNLFLSLILPPDNYQGFVPVGVSILSNFVSSIGLPICILLIAYKMLKRWYLEEEERNALTVSNTNAELLLLKAQVHPHFLFNTLNNIYSFTLHKSPTAGELVTKLMHIIRYMTTECDRPLVSLDQEIKLIQDYIGLEKIRYGNRLDLQVQIVGETKNRMIVPLLMIPFIENSFKHGASRMLDRPCIKLKIQVGVERLIFALSNSYPNTINNTSQLTLPPAVLNGKHGLGLKNVKRRLQILYPADHTLKINSEAEMFAVLLEVPLKEFHSSSVLVNPASMIQNEIPTYVRV